MANVSDVKSKLFKAVSADPNGICAAQTTSGAADLTLNGAQVTDDVAADGSNMATTVTITSAGSDESGDAFEVVGTDANGDAQTESSITGPGTSATVTTSAAFLTVTGVSVDGALTGNVTVGFTATSTTTGVLFAGRTRVRGMHGVSDSGTAGALILRNTSQSGTKVMEIDAPAAAGTVEPFIPDNGVLCSAGAYVDISTGYDSVTMFYDG